MKSVGICVNLQKDADFSVTKSIIEIVNNLGASCEIADDSKNYDFVISLGGDGTFLATARKFSNSPIVGINLGNLGVLSEIDIDDMEVELSKLINNLGFIGDGFLLETTLHDKNICALNDIVIGKGNFTKLLKFDLYFDDKFVDSYSADGLIVSTPTGSTAYSLSAGGPIIEPKLDVLVVTPICAHSLHQRPIVVDADTKVKVVSNNNDFMIIADGQESIENENIYEVVIKRSSKKVKIIKTTENCFFDTVREKFH